MKTLIVISSLFALVLIRGHHPLADTSNISRCKDSNTTLVSPTISTDCQQVECTSGEDQPGSAAPGNRSDNDQNNLSGKHFPSEYIVL